MSCLLTQSIFESLSSLWATGQADASSRSYSLLVSTRDHMSPLKSIGYHNSQGNNRDTRVCVRVYRKTEKHSTVTCFFLSFITSHASIMRKPLRRGTPLTFAKCQSFSDRSCNIFLELTRWRNFDVRSRTGTTNARVHQSRMLRWYAKKSCFEKICSLYLTGERGRKEEEGGNDFVGKEYKIRFLENESFPKFPSRTLTTMIRSMILFTRSKSRGKLARSWSTRHTLIERKNLHAIRFDIREENASLIHTAYRQRDDCERASERARDGRARSLACAHERTTAAVQLQLCVQAGNAGGGMEAARWAHSVSSLLFPFLAHTLSFSYPDVLHLPSPSLFDGQGTVILSLLCPRKLRFSLTLALFTESSAALPSLSHSSPFHYLSLVVPSPLLATASYLPSFFDDSVRPNVYLPLVQPSFSL